VNIGERLNGDRKTVKLSEIIIIAAFGGLLFFALISYPFEELASFNPVEWLADSINGFFDWIINLFFGWLI